MSERVFSEEELRAMGERTLDVLKRAIEAGDKDQAATLAQRMYDEFLLMHDMYADWAATLLDYVYKKDGADGVEQANRQFFGAPRAAAGADTVPDIRTRVQGLAFWLRGHLVPMKVEEDDEKVSLTMRPCGSGQRQVQRGLYQSPCNLTMIQDPHRITWGKTDFPIYCTHSATVEILQIEQQGYPSPVNFSPDKVAREESCSYCFYKNPDDIPEEVYTRVGKQKPARKSSQ